MNHETAIEITLLRAERKSYGDIAKRLGLSVNTVKSYCLRHDLGDNRIMGPIPSRNTRPTKQTLKTMEQVKKEWPEIPIIVVLTKSFFIYEDEDNIAMVKEIFEKIGKRTGSPLAIVPVLAEAPKGEAGIIARGIEDLIEITVNNIDDAVKASDEAVA